MLPNFNVWTRKVRRGFRVDTVPDRADDVKPENIDAIEFIKRIIFFLVKPSHAASDSGDDHYQSVCTKLKSFLAKITNEPVSIESVSPSGIKLTWGEIMSWLDFRQTQGFFLETLWFDPEWKQYYKDVKEILNLIWSKINPFEPCCDVVVVSESVFNDLLRCLGVSEEADVRAPGGVHVSGGSEEADGGAPGGVHGSRPGDVQDAP